MRNFLKELGIEAVGYFSDNNNYIVDIENSDDFNKVFSKLDNCDLLEEDEDFSVVNVNASNIMYFSDKYTINLIADYDENKYKLVISDGDNNE